MAVATVVIGQFDPLLLRGLEETLSDDSRVRVLAAGLRGAELERAVKKAKPDVLIVGEQVNHSLLARLKARSPSLGVLVLAYAQPVLSRTTLLAAGLTCLRLSSSAEQLARAVRLTAHEKPQASATFSEPLPGPTPELTDREIEVLELLGQDYLHSEIADELHIAESTVKTHAAKIKRKLGIKHRRELHGIEVSLARSQGLVTPRSGTGPPVPYTPRMYEAGSR